MTSRPEGIGFKHRIDDFNLEFFSLKLWLDGDQICLGCKPFYHSRTFEVLGTFTVSTSTSKISTITPCYFLYRKQLAKKSLRWIGSMRDAAPGEYQTEFEALKSVTKAFLDPAGNGKWILD